jgi:hypothetical protein
VFREFTVNNSSAFVGQITAALEGVTSLTGHSFIGTDAFVVERTS